LDTVSIVIWGIIILVVLRVLSSARPQRKPRYHQGLYPAENPEKYDGDLQDINYRSSWELKAFKWCDLNPKIVRWASEEVEIPYFMKGVRGSRNYKPDLEIDFRDGNKLLVEIKPDDEIADPSYKNRCKWAAARQYCRENGLSFRLWGENTILKLEAGGKYWQGVQQEKLLKEL
jgi:hypothetical protein